MVQTKFCRRRGSTKPAGADGEGEAVWQEESRWSGQWAPEAKGLGGVWGRTSIAEP